MDNLTHSLAGALLGQMGLKRLTGRAMPTLIVAANLPDIDAFTTVMGLESLALRRGVTHGPIAMVALPLLLTGAILLFDRWRPGREPVRPWSILLLAAIGSLSHPALDWLNTYGIRLLEPFSSLWFYGDTLFIIDVWLWAALILGVWLSLRRERAGKRKWRSPAMLSFTAIGAYVLANAMITRRAEAMTVAALLVRSTVPIEVVAQPPPGAFWQRRMLWRDSRVYGDGHFALFGGLTLNPRAEPNKLGDPRLATAVRDDPAVRAFLFWSRMPIVIDGPGGAVLADQRFHGGLNSGRFTVPLDARSP